MRNACLVSLITWLSCGCAGSFPVPTQAALFANTPQDLPLAIRDAQEAAEEPAPYVSMAMLVGAGYWPSLGDLQSDGSLLPPEALGGFDDWGFSADIVFEIPVAEVGGATLKLGLDLGLMSFANEQEFDVIVVPPGHVFEDRVFADLYYFTPSARLAFPVTQSVRAYTGLGLGYYLVSFGDSTTDYYYDPLAEDGAFGGFVAVGLDIFFGGGNIGLRIEDKLHYADFGSVRGFSNNLDGLINTIEIGVVFGF